MFTLNVFRLQIKTFGTQRSLMRFKSTGFNCSSMYPDLQKSNTPCKKFYYYIFFILYLQIRFIIGIYVQQTYRFWKKVGFKRSLGSIHLTLKYKENVILKSRSLIFRTSDMCISMAILLGSSINGMSILEQLRGRHTALERKQCVKVK